MFTGAVIAMAVLTTVFSLEVTLTPPEIEEMRKGDGMMVNCDLRGASPNNIVNLQWVNPQGHEVTNTDTTKNVFVSGISSSVSLHITDLKMGHRGTWTCKAVIDSHTFQKSIFVSTSHVRRVKRVVTLATIASSALSAGANLAGTTMSALLSNAGFSIVAGIEIDNYSKWMLTDPYCYPRGGHISTPPGDVHPGERDAMVAHKTGYSATGTYGTVSWLVGSSEKRIVVMWSVPYDHTYHSNWMAVGIAPKTMNELDDGKKLFNSMYHETHPWFRRQEYWSSVKSIKQCDNDMCIYGIMGTSYKPTVKITFYSKRKEDLAPAVQASISKRETTI